MAVRKIFVIFFRAWNKCFMVCAIVYMRDFPLLCNIEKDGTGLRSWHLIVVAL